MNVKVRADRLQPGDVLCYRGHPHRITEVIRQPGWAWPIAVDGTGWAIALGDHLVNVGRRSKASMIASPHTSTSPQGPTPT